MPGVLDLGLRVADSPSHDGARSGVQEFPTHRPRLSASDTREMSGHSKWATTKHQKGAKDKARGKLFAKLIRQVEVAAREAAVM